MVSMVKLWSRFMAYKIIGNKLRKMMKTGS